MIKKYSLLIIAVFCCVLSGFGQTYNQVTTVGGLVDGNYLIVGDAGTDGLMKNTTSGSVIIDYTSIINPTAIISSGFTSDNVFVISVTSGVITIYNSSVGYASWGRSGVTGNDADFFNGAVADTEKWAATLSGGLWTLSNVDDSTRKLQWNSAAPRFVAYTSNQTKLKLYKESVSSPTITTSTSSLTGFNYVEGSGPSAEQSFQVDGNLITAGIDITAPTNFLISKTSGGPYTSSVNIPPLDVNNTNTIYVVLAGSLGVNTYSGNITMTNLTVGLLSTPTVAVSGEVALACTTPTNQATSLSFSNVGSSSMDVSFTASSPAADNYLVVQSTSSSLSANPIDGTSYSVTDALGGGTVVYNGSGTSFTASGLSQSTQYYYFVFAYNDVACTGGPKYNTTALSDDETTLSGPCLSEDFSGWSHAYGNWTETTSDGTWTANSSYAGSNRIQMNDVGDWLELPTVNNPTTLTYDYALSSSQTATNQIQVQYWDGSSWFVAATHTSIGTTFINYSADLSAVTAQTNVRLRLYRSADNRTAYLDNIEVFCGIPTPEPEINIQGNATDIADGNTVISTGDNTDFGNVAVTGGTNPNTFTIQNTGTADLNITSVASSNNTEFAVTGTTSGIITAGNDATFTVTFNPNALGTRTATITVISDDADEGTYTFNVEGNGTNSNASDIITNTTFGYASNIDYTTHQIATITNTTNSRAVFKFDIRDGGAAANDSDALSTELTDIEFTVDKLANIRTAALFDGNALVDDSPTIGGGKISFSGLSVSAADNTTKSLTLRVSFNATVTDNDKLIFTISSATANASGSSFATSNAGGAESDSNTANDRNRLEVTATQLNFAQQPSDALVNTNMAPAVTVGGYDTNNNLDLDFTDSISITSTGTLTGSPVAINAVNGIATFSNLTHTVIGTGLTLTASHSTFTNVVSGLFDIEVITYTHGDFRTTSNGVWNNKNDAASTVTWERYTTGSGWTANPTSPSATDINVYIYHDVEIPTSTTQHATSKIVVEDGAILTFKATNLWTFRNLIIKKGGTVDMQTRFRILSGRDFEIEDEGDFWFNYSANAAFTSSLTSSLWNGEEVFHPNSNFIVKDHETGSGNYFLPVETELTTQSYNGVTAYFGNLIFDGTGDARLTTSNLSSTTNYLTHGNLEFRPTDNVNLFYGSGTWIVGNDFIFNAASSGNITMTTGNHTINLNIKGSFINNSDNTFRVANTSSSNTPNVSINVDENLVIANAGIVDVNFSSGATGTINLKGDLTVASSAKLFANNATTATFNFNGTGDGLNAATTQTIDIASTSVSENQYIDFNIKSGAYVQLINRDFELGQNSKLTVEDNATLDFGFNGTTALNVAISGSQTGTDFSSLQGSTLKITSPEGISKTGYTNNVQTAAYLRDFDQNATFHYIGKQNQVTGNGLTTLSTGKILICDLINNNTQLTLSNNTAINNSTTINPLGGALDIRVGQFIETLTAYVVGTSGRLIMEDGTLYQIPALSGSSVDLIPRLNNTSITYALSGSSTIRLNGAGNQILRGGKSYRNLTFSTSGIKDISSSILNITGTILTENDAVLNIEYGETMGGSGTNLTMIDNSEYVTASTTTGAVKPAAQGAYNLIDNSKIIFAHNSGNGATLQKIRLNKTYNNLDVIGDNVGTETTTSGIKFNSTYNPIFTVKPTGVFKFNNTTGFSGNTGTAIDNTNAPATITLEPLSTVEYAGTTQTITSFSPEYKNVTISGSATKTLGHATDILIGEDLNVTSSTLLVDTDEIITVDESVEVTTGANFNIENAGSLIQINDASLNTGNISMKRTASIKNLDYVYWASPVVDFPVNNIWTTNRIYRWGPTTTNANNTEGDWVNAIGNNMSPALGYILRAPSGTSTTPVDYTSTFVGKPQNGVISVNVSRGNDTPADNDDDNWNLIGNPYPSAISADDFLGDHTNEIKGWIKLWTHGDPPGSFPDFFYEDFTNNYNLNDYLTYNYMGSSSGPGTFSGYIAAGQAFFVNMKEGTTTGIPDTQPVTFKNAYRQKVAGYNNNEFFRNNEISNTNEKHRIWLDLINETTGISNRILVGYTAASTLEKDHLFDAENIESGIQNFYSTIENEPFFIQGRGDFNDLDVIPLGMQITNAGNHIIAISSIDGLFETTNQTIYLRDNNSGFVHNLTETPYTFTSEVGEFNNRFEIVFRDSLLALNDEEISNNQIQIIELKNGEVQFTVPNNLEIHTVEIIDLLGRRIYKLKGHSYTETYNLSTLSQATYIAKISLSNGQVISKKILKRR